jgi:prevent-host-death family protein
MDRIIGVTELQRRFKSVFDDVINNQTPYILTRGSRPEAVLIPYEEYVRYQTINEENLKERFEEALEKIRQAVGERSEEEMQADIEAAIREVRQQYGK